MERIDVKDVESFRVAALEIKAPRYEKEKHFKQLSRWLKQRSVKPRKRLAIFYDKVHEFDSNKVIKYEVCFEIKETIKKEEEVQIKELPQQRMATIAHHGSCEKISSTYKTLLEWIKNEGYVVKGPPREVYIVPSSLEDKSDSKDCVMEIQFPIGQKFTQRLFAVMGNWTFPHFFVAFQWALILFGVMSFIDFSIIIPGSRANGELKVVMTSHLWVLLFSVILCFLFYKHKGRGRAEKGIFGVSMVAALFSVAHFILHFINDFLLLMWITGIIAWVFYLLVFATSVYIILATFLTYVLGRTKRDEENNF